jgi:ATP-dependent Clp protease ATP-binding subunit ClpB
MNINKFTIKSQEAIQRQQLAQGYGQQQIENEHILRPYLKSMKM